MEQFNKEHQEAFGRDAPIGGNPDDGNGYYSEKLTYRQWYDFNNVQRAHMNFLEHMAPTIFMTIITALRQPLWAMITIFVLVLGRIVYGCGYVKKGPNGRLVGAYIVDLGLLSGVAGCIYTMVTWGEINRVIPFSPNSIPGTF